MGLEWDINMKWNDLKTNPPTGKEYAVILFPCRSDCGILYIASNPHYAIQNGVEAGYTHWTEIELAPTHTYWDEWQEGIQYQEKYGDIDQDYGIFTKISFMDEDEELLTRRKEAAERMAKAYEENADRWAEEQQKMDQELDPKPL